MPSHDVKIAATDGGPFDCYLALPDTAGAPAVVIMPSVFGADDDVRQAANDLAAQGFVAAAPDLFWRGDGGPMPRTDEGRRRAQERARDRDVLIEQGVRDLADVIAHLKGVPECNGRVAVVGLCYGGPYAILGPARLGCDAGISFHGTKVENHLDELDRVQVPLSLHWGDQDHAAPPDVLERVQAAIRGLRNAEVTVYPGVNHGYSAPSSEVWDADAAERSWRRAVEILNTLRDVPQAASA